MYIIISTTTDNKNVADSIAKKVLDLNLSPCVQIYPDIESTYIWDNNLKKTKEFIIQIKTIDKNLDLIVNIIKDTHNYTVPEIMSHRINLHNTEYEKWFITNSKGKE